VLVRARLSFIIRHFIIQLKKSSINIPDKFNMGVTVKISKDRIINILTL